MPLLKKSSALGIDIYRLGVGVVKGYSGSEYGSISAAPLIHTYSPSFLTVSSRLALGRQAQGILLNGEYYAVRRFVTVQCLNDDFFSDDGHPKINPDGNFLPSVKPHYAIEAQNGKGNKYKKSCPSLLLEGDDDLNSQLLPVHVHDKRVSPPAHIKALGLRLETAQKAEETLILTSYVLDPVKKQILITSHCLLNESDYAALFSLLDATKNPSHKTLLQSETAIRDTVRSLYAPYQIAEDANIQTLLSQIKSKQVVSLPRPLQSVSTDEGQLFRLNVPTASGYHVCREASLPAAPLIHSYRPDKASLLSRLALRLEDMETSLGGKRFTIERYLTTQCMDDGFFADHFRGDIEPTYRPAIRPQYAILPENNIRGTSYKMKKIPVMVCDGDERWISEEPIIIHNGWAADKAFIEPLREKLLAAQESGESVFLTSYVMDLKNRRILVTSHCLLNQADDALLMRVLNAQQNQTVEGLLRAKSPIRNHLRVLSRLDETSCHDEVSIMAPKKMLAPSVQSSSIFETPKPGVKKEESKGNTDSKTQTGP